MALMESILQRIDDHEPVIGRMEKSVALKGLVEGYQRYTHDDATLPIITSLTTGLELKAAVRKLSPEHQLDLLKKYSDTVHGIHPHEPADKVEERRHRHWLVKLFSVVVSSLMVLLIVTLVSVIIKGNSNGGAGVLTSTMSIIVEIIKLIFNVTK